MKDRYLYRAKKKGNEEWITGNLIQSSDAEDGWEAIIIPIKNSNMFCKHIENDYSTMFTKPIGRGCGNLGFENWYRVVPSTICQCTGLKDKNGKLIWENDIIAYRDCTEEKYVIAWELDKACFEYQQYSCSIMNFDELSSCEVEVIGNIFDNPELLESEG